MNRSAIVLAGDLSSRFGQDADFWELNNKPLVKHVVDAVSSVVDETIVVTHSQNNAAKYAEILGSHVKFAVDSGETKSSVIGALAGFELASQKYSLLLSSNAPFVSREIVELLFELCYRRSAVVPRWPNQQIEPLHTVFLTQMALEAAKQAVTEGKLDLYALVEDLRGVRYVSTLVIQELDPELKSFFTVNTLLDLKRAAVIAKPRKTKKKQSRKM